MREPSYLQRICPVCGSNSLVQGEAFLGIGSSSYRCAACGAALKVRPTARVIWAFLVAALVVATIILLQWLEPRVGLGPHWRAALVGGIGGGGMAYSFKLIAQGMVCRPQP